jgi:hypothetical protein
MNFKFTIKTWRIPQCPTDMRRAESEIYMVKEVGDQRLFFAPLVD